MVDKRQFFPHRLKKRTPSPSYGRAALRPLSPLFRRQRRSLDIVRYAALSRSTCCRPQLWAISVALNPRRWYPGTRCDQQGVYPPAYGCSAGPWLTTRLNALALSFNGAFRSAKWTYSAYILWTRGWRPEARQQFITECRQCRRTRGAI